MSRDDAFWGVTQKIADAQGLFLIQSFRTEVLHVLLLIPSCQKDIFHVLQFCSNKQMGSVGSAAY